MPSLFSGTHPDLHVGSKGMKETGRKVFLNEHSILKLRDINKQTNKKAWTLTHFSDASSHQFLFFWIDSLVCIACHFYRFVPEDIVKNN